MSIQLQTLINNILDFGTTDAILFDAALIEYNEDFRKACEQNLCGKFNTTWSGPPAVGSVNELIKRTKSFRQCIFVQNVYQLEDSFDYPGMLEGARKHEQKFREILEFIRENYDFQEILPLNAGCCSYCPDCTYPSGLPCRFPTEAVSSLECYGIDVLNLKRKIGLPILAGPDTVAYAAAFFIRE